MASRYPIQPIPSRGESLGWAASGTPAQRSLSHNGGYIPTPQFLGLPTSQRTTPVPGEAPVTPLAKPALEGLGKSSIRIAPARPSYVSPDYEEAPTQQLPGFAEGVLGGLVEAFTGALPGWLRDPVVGLARGAGKLADIPLEAVGHVPLPFVMSRRQAFDTIALKFPTAETQHVKDLITSDPVNAEWYMASFLRTHGSEVARAQGLPELLAPLVQPDATIWERAFATLGVGSQMVGRTQAGMTGRADQILGLEGDDIHPELQSLKKRYESGEFGPVGSGEANDRFLDAITVSGFAWSNDPFVSMMVEMFTDPLIIAGGVTGAASKAVRLGAGARRAANLTRIASSAESGSVLRGAFDDAVRKAAGLTQRGRVGDDTYNIAKQLMDDARPEVQDAVRRATDELPDRDKSKLLAQPLIERLAQGSAALNAPFGFFGRDGPAGRALARFSRHSSQGVLSAYDLGRVRRLTNGTPEALRTTLERRLSLAIAYSQKAMMQGNLTKFMRSSIKDADGNYLPTRFVPDAVTPDNALDQMVGDNPLLSQQSEAFARRTREQFIPEGGSKAEQVRQMDAMREDAAQKWAKASGMDIEESRALFKNANENDLSFADFAHWGYAIETFNDAAQAATKSIRQSAIEAPARQIGDEALSDLEVAARATPVGPRELTVNRAETLLKELEGADAEAIANAAVNQYETLFNNFLNADVQYGPGSLVNHLTAYLKDAIENKRLVQTVDEANLPPQLKAWLDDMRAAGKEYEIGIAPDVTKLWSPIKDPTTGRVIGYSPWMGIKNVTAGEIGMPNRFDVLRQRLFTPIRAENIVMEARRTFIRRGMQEHQLSRGEAIQLFDAVRTAAAERGATPRSFTQPEFLDIMAKTKVSEHTQARLGSKGLAVLVAQALEGDVRMVGITSKLTGRMKTVGAHTGELAGPGNLVGVLSEKVYPLLRFHLNPVFLMQEWIEPYFFNRLRGVKAGVTYTQAHVEMHDVLEQWNFHNYLVDGMEARDYSITNAHKLHRSAGAESKLSRIFSRVTRGNSLRDRKRIQSQAMLKQQWGDEFHRMLHKEFPGMWARIEAFFNEADVRHGGTGNLSRGDVTLRYFSNKGMFDPDTQFGQVAFFDMANPDSMGRIDGIRHSYVARLLGYDRPEALRTAVRDGSLDEWTYRADLVAQGATPEYAERAYQVTKGMSPTELYDSVRTGFADPVEGAMAAEMLDAWVQIASTVKDLSPEEYVARKFASQTVWLDSTGKLPYNAYTQLSERIMEEAGFAKMLPDDPRYVETMARAKAMMPATLHKTVPEHIRAATSATEGIRPTGASAKGLVDGPKQVGDIKLNPVMNGEQLIDSMVMDEDAVRGSSGWYPAIGPMFASYVHGLDDDAVRALGEAMNAKLSTVRRIDLDDLDSIRAEVSARMMMGWGATQVRISPQDGFGYLLTTIDQTVRGKRQGQRGIGLFGPQQKQLEAMFASVDETLRIDGMSVKLHDFVDSILGNRTRSFLGENKRYFTRRDGSVHEMQPGAMDIWMGRGLGYVDDTYLRALARHLLDKDPTLNMDSALRQAEEATGVKLGEGWSGSPTAPQYESMLHQVHVITDELNSRPGGWLGKGYGLPGGEWTVPEVQAVIWENVQRQIKIEPGGANSMVHQNAMQVSFEVLPGANTPLADAIPMHRASADAKDNITGDVAVVLADMVQQRTGVRITRVVPGMGGWRNAPGEYTLSPNTFWEMAGNDAQLDDALDYIAYLTQQDQIFATRPITAVPGTTAPSKSSAKKGYAWGIDFAPKVDDALTLDALGQYMNGQGFTWNGHMVGSQAGGNAVVRTVFSPDPEAGPLYTNIPDEADLAGFEAAFAIPDDLRAKLEDGSWAVDSGFADEAIPVTISRDLHLEKHRKTDFSAQRDAAEVRRAAGEDAATVYRDVGINLLEGLRGRGREDIADALVGGDMATVTALWDDSLKRHASNAWATGRGHRFILDSYAEGPQPHLQSSPRGWRGATAWTSRRSATHRVATGELGGRTGRLYLKEGRADLTTIVHETFHFFADDLEPSAIESIHNAWWAAKGSTSKRRGLTKPTDHSKLVRDAEEWTAQQFEEWAASGLAPNVQMNSVFQAYAQTFKGTMGRDPNVNPALRDLFDGMTPEVHRGPPATFDIDHFRIMEAARIALQRAEDEAHRVHFYKRGRNVIERSINHPYLGLYPASYMWGKVLPEIVRFLVRKPFGYDAPFAGLAAANHIWEAIQLDLATEEPTLLQDLIDNFPEALHFLTLLVPGTPWDIPVNAPAWTRRVAQDAWAQKEPDIPAALTDTIMYSYGPARAFKDLANVAADLGRLGQRTGQTLTGERPGLAQTPEEVAAAQAGPVPGATSSGQLGVALPTPETMAPPQGPFTPPQ